VSPSLLSEVFSGRKNFSYERLNALQPKLRVGAFERRHFRMLIDLENTTDPRRVEKIRTRIATNAHRTKAKVIAGTPSSNVV
jgi:hypothetical protein